MKYTPQFLTKIKVKMHMKNTIIYPSHFELMEQLTDLQAGKLIKSIGQYEKGLLPAIDDDLVKGIFISIKRDFDLQSENYESVCKRNRENAKNAGAKKGNQNARKYNDLIQGDRLLYTHLSDNSDFSFPIIGPSGRTKNCGPIIILIFVGISAGLT